MKRIDLAGRRFGQLTVLRYAGKQKWLCRCDCGREKEIAGYSLLHDITQSCRQPGCTGVDLAGQQIFHLTVLSRVVTARYASWLCRCECGNYRVVQTSNLTSGRLKSCGCRRSEALSKSHTTHGHKKRESPAYAAWASAKERCFNPKHHAYKDYGGRGITMCDEWRNNFLAFFNYMGQRPPGLSLDRFPNNDGNYEPGNVRWANRSQQAYNRRPKSRHSSSLQSVLP